MDKNKKKRVWSLGILCFQGFGIRIFEDVLPGAIVIWTFLLFFLNIESIIKIQKSIWAKFLLILLVYLFVCSLKGITPTYYLFSAWISSLFVLSNYIKNQKLFIEDLYSLTKVCVIYSLMHVPIMVLLDFGIISTEFPMHPKTFLYLFYFNRDVGIGGLNRIQGFCWEPSCWHMLLNLNLILILYFKKTLKELVANVLAIITVMSTAGLVVMAINIVIYMLITLGKNKTKLIVLFVVGLLCFPFVYNELKDKLSTGSGNSRIGDVYIALTVLGENPILGGDLDNITSNVAAMTAREDAWTTDIGDYEGYMEQGMVNSFAALFVEWGCLALILLYLFYKTPLIMDKKLRLMFFVCVCCVLMGTPIARTGFFFIFIFSSLLITSKQYSPVKL